MGPEVRADLLLVGCVKSRSSEPALARDLFTSDYFAKMRSHAEGTGLPWFIVTAEHGLVWPEQWLEPYALCLADMRAGLRRSWGGRVAARLRDIRGSLQGTVVEIHAGSTYVQALGPALERLGAEVLDPLRGLPIGRRLAWYRQH